MTPIMTLRRAALLGFALTTSACDVVAFINDPKPRFEQTWNVPATTSQVSVAELLPTDNSVRIVPDSSAFTLTVSGTNISRRVGNDCAQCETLNGTNAFKPAFVLNAGNSSPLPQTVATAAIISGAINVVLTNNMSFDPLFVRNNPPSQPQGYMLIVVRSAGGVVLGRDSVNGATTPWPAGTQLTRNIALVSGTAASSLTVDVTLNSPAGDHNEFINANGTLNATATVPTLNVASVGLNVVNNQITSVRDTLDLSDLDESITKNVVRGALEMTITNPFAVTGTVNVRFAYGPQPGEVVAKSFSLPTGVSQKRLVTLDSLDMSRLLGRVVEFTIDGAVNSAAPVTVTPKQAMTISNRLIVTIRTGGN